MFKFKLKFSSSALLVEKYINIFKALVLLNLHESIGYSYVIKKSLEKKQTEIVVKFSNYARWGLGWEEILKENFTVIFTGLFRIEKLWNVNKGT